MRNISDTFKQELYENNHRNYVCNAVIELADNSTTLTVTNAQIWQNGVSWDDSVSEETTFGALGSAIINSITLVINNMQGDYSDYDFKNAKVTLNVGIEIGTILVVSEYVKIGTVTVEETTYNGSLISLYCLDNMAKFDKPYSRSSLVYPATLQSILTNACTDCGVILNSTTFPNYNLTISTRPLDEAITYREIVSYVATLAGCFARCNADGELELKWFDRNALESDDSILHINSLSSNEFSTENVIITGVQINVVTITNAETTTNEHLFGTDGYVIKVENNPFITESNVNEIGNYLSTLLVGLTFRKATISHLNDPSIEAGDIAIVTDRKGNNYPILITNTTFNISQYQRTISAADTPTKNSATRFTEVTKSYVASNKLVQQEKTLREQLGTNLTNAINAKAGMYESHVQEAGGGYTYYLHDKPQLSQSTAVIKITNEAVGITPNYQASTPIWYGLTVDGNFIANIMSVIGIDFDWGTGGSLVLGGQNNVNGTLTIKNASNTTIGSWTNAGINAQTGLIGPWTIEATGIYSGKTAFDADGSIGVYLGTDGLALEDTDGMTFIGTNGGIVLKEKTGSGTSAGLYIESHDGYIASLDPGSLALAQTSDHSQINLHSATDAYGSGVYAELLDNTNHCSVEIGWIGGAALASPERVGIKIQGRTSASNAYDSANPTLEFQNIAKSQNISLIFTDYDSIQSPASLTLIGNQGGEYFIAPNIKATGSLYGAGATLTGSLVVDRYVTAKYGIILRNDDYTKGTNPTAATNRTIRFTDKEGYSSIANDLVGLIECGCNTTGMQYTLIRAYNANTSGTLNSQIMVAYPKDGTPYFQIDPMTYAKGNVLVGASKTAAYTQQGVWIGANGNITLTKTSGGAGIYFAYDGSDGYTSGIYESSSGILTFTAGMQIANGKNIQCGTSSSTSNQYVMVRNSTHLGSFLSQSSTGRLGIYSDTVGGWLIYMNANGTPYIKNIQGLFSFPIITNDVDGKRIASFGCYSATQLQIHGQWGTTGTTYASRYVSVSTSDIRLKENIKDCSVSALPVIDAIRMREFDWIADKKHQSIGMVADELELIDKNLIIGSGEDGDVKCIDTFYLLGYLVKAIQELSAEIKKLKGE